MTIHNIAQYRKAQAHVKELEKAMKVLLAAEASLKNYENYRPIQHILTTISLEKPFLEVFLEQNKIIVETKGTHHK